MLLGVAITEYQKRMATPMTLCLRQILMLQSIHASKHALVVSRYIKLILTATPECQNILLIDFPDGSNYYCAWYVFWQ